MKRNKKGAAGKASPTKKHCGQSITTQGDLKEIRIMRKLIVSCSDYVESRAFKHSDFEGEISNRAIRDWHNGMLRILSEIEEKIIAEAWPDKNKSEGR